MNENIEQNLENIGLTKSEIKVYISLLKIGDSSAGNIVIKSKTANSKIYEVLEKLIDKGLVSFFLKDKVKHYKAASPNIILEYLKEKKEKIQKQESDISNILPYLMEFQQEDEEKKEVALFSGPKGVKTAFKNMTDKMTSEDELFIMGTFDFGDSFLHIVKDFHKNRANKKIKCKIVSSHNGKRIINELKNYPPIETRLMPENIKTPAIFLIYLNKVIISLGGEYTVFELTSKSANEAFKQYFNTIWDMSEKY